MSNITAIVNVFKRPHTLDIQIEAIRAQTVPPACIFIWNNGNKEVDLTKYKSMPDVRVFDNNFNYGVWSRFLIGLLAPTEYICVFDDDTVPGTRWFENCLSAMKQQTALYGTIGVIFQELDRYISWKRYGWDGPCDRSMPVDIVGHSWFFKKEWLSYFVREEPQVYSKISNGEDMHFSFMLQKYANIPTLVPPHPANDQSLWGSQPKTAWEWGCDGRSETGSHFPMDAMYKEYIGRGFITLRQRQHATSQSDIAMFMEKIRKRTPFAVIRPSDGEYYVLQNLPLTNCDYWTFTPGGALCGDLTNAIHIASKTACYVGIPCECDNPSMAQWYYQTFHLHPNYTTFANVFVNANWHTFVSFLIHEKISFTYIGPKYTDTFLHIEEYVPIPEFLVNDWDAKRHEYLRRIETLVTKHRNRIFLFSCGPIAKILIAHVWAIHPHNIYLDVGSCLDLFMKGSTNRFYTTGKQKSCQFTPSLITI
jgi:hypothetical protein